MEYFLGYEEVSKAYRVYDIEAGQVVISRDINFDESAFGLLPLNTEDDVADDLSLDLLDIADDYLRPSSRLASANIGLIIMKKRLANLARCMHDLD